ncbi:MAG: Uma2 family endonuclease [Gemmataceae bacterium]
MATATTIDTLADLVEQLGGIPLRRIRYQPYPGTATEADVLKALEAPRKRLCELIDGVLVEKTMGYSESILASFLIELLNSVVRTRNLGHVTSPDGPLRLWSGRIRLPDVAFVSWDRLPHRRRPEEPIPDLVPDLAVEILSANNTAAEMRLKRQDYFSTGVRLVWEIDPATRTARVYSAVDTFTELREADTLDGAPVLPGFTLPLRQLFAELDRQG